MKIGYIKQLEKAEDLLTERQIQYAKIIQKMIYIIKKFFLIPNIIELNDSIIIILPLFENERISENKMKRIVKKIRKRAYIKNVAVSNFLLKEPHFQRFINKNKMHILDGTWLWSYMILNLIKYVTSKKEKQIQKQEVAFLVKESTEINIQNIIETAKNVKLVNIITPYTEKFKMIEDYLYSTYGIIIHITNSKKALIRSNIIINIDFSGKELSKYSILEKAVILNKSRDIKIETKKFTGINCSTFKIKWNEQNIKELKEHNIYNCFNKNILYESAIFRKDSYKNIIQQIEIDNVEITRTYWYKWNNRR